MQSVNPLNGQIIQTYKALSEKEIVTKITEADAAWLLWKQTTFQKRALLLLNAAIVLRNRKEELARLMALEMGKPLSEGRSEIEKCAVVCEFYGAQGARFLKEEPVHTEGRKRWVCFRPLGVILAVMPWNFPFWQVFRFLAPGLMAGNCGLLKHASNVPGCALAIENILLQAGAPPGVFQTLLAGSGAVAGIISHPVIKGVAFTGSTAAGQRVAGVAGASLKKAVLELGGSDPYIILADADLQQAAEVCVASRLVNNGQSCIAAKRFIVSEEVEAPFTALIREKMMAKQTGDPLLEKTQLGPMARKDLRDELHQQVLENIRAGAKCILGGNIPALPGDHAFYEPTILTGIQKGMPAYREEMFGPVASVITVKNDREAIRVANDTSFGLGAAVFTKDAELAEAMAKDQLEAGSCFINSMVRSDPQLPFGGIKQSGFGRELGAYGIREFVNIKTVVAE